MARARLETAQVHGRELVPSHRNLILWFYTVKRDEQLTASMRIIFSTELSARRYSFTQAPAPTIINAGNTPRTPRKLFVNIPVRDLQRQDFVVTDNGVSRRVEHLWFDNDAPLTIGVIVDASESQREQLDEHRQTVIELLTRLMRSGDKAFVVSVDEDVRLWARVSATR